MTSQTVKNIGKYEIIDVLGRGGMGVVYKALDSRMDRLVAIKMMTAGFAENSELLKRFYREAKSTGMLQHPGIVIVYDLGEEDGNPYLVMEYLEGQSLGQAIASGTQFSILDKLGMMVQICDALQYAHQRGVVHRDIKPANIMVLKDGNVKLVDFGIARIGDHTLTQTGQLVGTVSYMSPEQINGHTADARSDIFSAGVLFYELLTGQLPFHGPDATSTLMKIVQDPVPPLHAHLPDCPPDLEPVIQKALAKEREERYQTAEDLAFELARLQETLRRGMAKELISRARDSINNAEFSKAKEFLHQVLKADSQHTVAKELVHEVQMRLQQQQREERLASFQASAQRALAEEQFDNALAAVQQALELAKTDPAILNLRDQIQQAKARKEQWQTLMRKATTAMDTGNFEAATGMLEEALRLDPSNSQASSLLAEAAKSREEEKKQQQLRALLDEARKKITERKLPEVFELLRIAESLDSASPELQAIKGIALSVQQQESRRKELERATREIQDALHREDFQRASSLASSALQMFPNDAGLLQLRGLCEKQREASEKKRFIEDQLSAARQMLDSGQANQAYDLLQQALEKLPGNPRLQSLLSLVRDSLDREKKEQVKAGYIERAKAAIQNKEFDDALKILETALAEVEESVELQNLAQFVREEAKIAAQRQQIQAAADEAQRLTAEDEFDQAIAILEAALHETPSDELRGLLQEVRRTAEAFNVKIESIAARAERLLAAQRIDEAISLLESQPQSYARSLTFRKTIEKAREEQARLHNIQTAVAGSRTAMEKGDFQAALEILNACVATYGSSPAIHAALQEVEKKRSATAKTALEKAIKDCRSWLLAAKYELALQSLDAVAALVPQMPSDIQSQYQALAKEATSGMDRQKRHSELSHALADKSKAAAETLVAGSYEPTIGVAAAPAPATPAPATPSLAAAVKAPPTRTPTVRPKVVAKPKRSWVWPAIAVVVLMVIGVVVIYLRQARVAPPKTTTYVQVNAVPWATVVSVRSVDGKYSLTINQQTPLRISLPPGEFVVNMTGPAGDQRAGKIKVSDNLPGDYTEIFESIDVEQILKSH